MPDTPTPAEPSPEWLNLMAGLIRSGSFIAREEREKIAAALSRLAQVERERDASDAALADAQWMENVKTALPTEPRPLTHDEAYRIRKAAIERHKRSRQQRGTT